MSFSKNVSNFSLISYLNDVFLFKPKEAGDNGIRGYEALGQIDAGYLGRLFPITVILSRQGDQCS